MRKNILIVTMIGFALSGCAIPSLPTGGTSPAPAANVDLQATAAVLSQQTLQALPTATIAPSNTAVITSPSSTATLASATPTQNSALATLTATLLTNVAPTSGTGTVVPTAGVVGTFTGTPTPALSGSPTTTPHPQHYGTMPPYLPFGEVTLINRAKAQVYVSLQCTTNTGFTSIVETPVEGSTNVKVPAGKCIYVAWVGGKKMVGDFSMEANGSRKFKIYKDHVTIGS